MLFYISMLLSFCLISLYSPTCMRVLCIPNLRIHVWKIYGTKLSLKQGMMDVVLPYIKQEFMLTLYQYQVMV